ncbi:MAG: alpha/beta hydrolase [Clostridiales bacterium]|nr:alpha/beta hydrolase [Clostridiales bacterium]
MFFYYNNTQVFYKRENRGGKTVLLLHGFGASSKTVDCLFYFLKNRGYDVISIDFPGFGQSNEPFGVWSIYDYADCVDAFIQYLSLKNVIVVGHSFGGRVGIILASNNKLDALILIDSAGVKPIRTLKYYLKVAIYKARKRLKLSTKRSGSEDYRSLSINMRATFVRVVNEHLDKLLSKITVPTLVLWGKQDKDTPVYMAKKINKCIKNSVLYIMNGGHYSYLDCYNETCMYMENFLCSL